jgi:hypothetical protein
MSGIIGSPGTRSGVIGTQIQPQQPAFLLRGDDGGAYAYTQTLAQITDYTEIFDQGGNVSASTFTAPVSGRYLFTAQIYFYGINPEDYIELELTTDNRNYTNYGSGIPGLDTVGATGGSLRFSVLTDMDANDTALLKIRNATGARGSNSNGVNNASFSGFLAA